MNLSTLFNLRGPIPIFKKPQNFWQNLFRLKYFFIFLFFLFLNSSAFADNSITYSNGPICSGTSPGIINGSGGFFLSWEWEQSTTSATSGFSDISGANGQSYTPGNLTQTTWFRRKESFLFWSTYSNVIKITVTPQPSATISYPSSPYCSDGGSASVSFTGTPGGVFSSTSGLSINSTSGIINLNSSTAGTYTISYTIAAGGGCSLFSTSANVTIINPGSWTGAVNTDWHNSGNWLCGKIPTSSTNVTIRSALSNYPTIAFGTTLANNLTIESGGSLTISGGILQIYGAINNSGVLSASNGTIDMKGASAQTISGSMFYKKTIKNLIVSNTGPGLSVASTLQDTLKITGTLYFGNASATLNTGDNITLVSNIDGTANVGIVGAGNTINGDVIVERYINIGTDVGQHAKSWQFLATPTIGQTVEQSWMENNIAASTGYGIMVTGKGGTAAGFDVYTRTPSIKYFNPPTQDWVGIANTNNSIYSKYGYMVFVRGDRSVTAYNQPANNTTLRTKGALFTGTLPSISLLPNSYASVGNPYASVIDFTQIVKGAAIGDKFYVWDPYLSGAYGLGGYQTLSSVNNWEPVPGGTSAYPSGTATSVIHSGQAFFVHSDSISPYVPANYQLNFDENNKIIAPPSSIIAKQFGISSAQNKQSLNVSLYIGNTIVDGATAVFGRTFSNSIDGKDALKILNGGENFSLKRNGTLLAIEAKAPLLVSDTLHYNLKNLQQKTYQLRFAPENMESTGMQAFLIDRFLNNSTSVSLTESSFVNINITSSPASYDADRFEIVFRRLHTLSVTFASISAVQKSKGILVAWTVKNENGLRQYEVEKSIDGIQFTKAATVAAKNNQQDHYFWLDENTSSGYHHYRIRSIGIDGQMAYSRIVKVWMGNLDASISVYPNPIVNGRIQIQLSNQPVGVYKIRLTNSLGQLILSKKVSYSDGNQTEVFTPAYQLDKGIYQLKVVKPDGSVVIKKIVN